MQRVPKGGSFICKQDQNLPWFIIDLEVPSTSTLPQLATIGAEQSYGMVLFLRIDRSDCRRAKVQILRGELLGLSCDRAS
jgi:hypothetical protein